MKGKLFMAQILDDNKMDSFNTYVLEECKRQWNECQAEIYGEWDCQDFETKKEYYEDMFQHLSSSYDDIDLGGV